ncbi:MAG: hypothetical protein JRE43_02365 [Deltaproteobacteria bacterium]|nr:hypothetical protein [Deltaproteobacteria bacterium]
MKSTSPSRDPRWRQRLSGAIALAAILIGATSWSQPHVDGSDLWWHLASGQYIWQHGEIPTTDPFSHTANGRDWTNHSWLWGALFWLAYDAHPDCAAWLQLALIAALFALVAWNARRVSHSWLAAGAASWLAAATCHWFFDLRPHVTTLLFTALLLSTLDWRRAAWLWPPLFALWANLHGGFAFGLGLIGLWTLMQTERAIRQRQALPRSAWIGLLCAALAASLNPWGFAIFGVPLQHIYYASPFSEIIEWQSVALSLDPRTYAGRFWWMVFFTLFGVFSGKATRFSIALAIVTAAMAISARRFIPLFAICAAPLAALGLGAIGSVAGRRFAALWTPRIRLIASAAALLVAILLWGDVRLHPRPLQRWTSAESYPSGAVAYLAAMPDPPKHLFNFYNWGGYLMLYAPDVPVFIDSRASTLYGDDFAAEYFGMMDAAEHWRERFESHGVDAALVPTHSRIAAALRNARPAWRVAYIDPRSALLFPPAGATRTRLPPPSQLLPDGVDLKLSRGFYWRRRGDLERAERALLAAQRADPLQIFLYGELMFVASLRGDAAGVERWLEAALDAYPRRWNPIWSFAEQAWSAMGRCEETRTALREIRLGSPFVADELRDEIQTRIREFACPPVE